MLDSKKTLDYPLTKILVNKEGHILGATKAFKELVGKCTSSAHISDIFEAPLLKKTEEIFRREYSQKIIVKKRLTGYMKIGARGHVTCFIIYQPSREKAIITLKIDETSDRVDQLCKNIFKTSLLPLAALDEEGYFIWANEGFSKCFPDPQNIHPIHLHHFLIRFNTPQTYSTEEFLLEARTQGMCEMKIVLKENGAVRHFKARLKRDPETELLILKAIDNTEQEQLYQQLAHSDQLSITGEIAASIAHEVRNPMTTLHGFLQLLEHQVTGDAHKYVTVIQEEVIRMNDILNEMLALSKPIVDEITVLSLSVLVEDVLVLLRPKALLDQIMVVCDNWLTEPALIKANPNRMKQVLVNLLKNAMEAMDAGGVLTVQLVDGEGETIRLLITDTGNGMDQKTIETIFEPFVSMKKGGTGLGLPFVKKTITEYGGTIAVNSELGKGTEIYLTIPRQTHAENILV